MVITRLDKKEYKGKKFILNYSTKGYYDIEKQEQSFIVTYKPFDEKKDISIEDEYFSDWLEAPIAFGAFENETLLGFIEGTLEKWNNRYRITNLCIFDKNARHKGIGTQLMNTILEEAKLSHARMAVLETQSSNEKAIAFYRKQGFEMIGFDLYAYTNHDPKDHSVRIEMGRFL